MSVEISLSVVINISRGGLMSARRRWEQDIPSECAEEGSLGSCRKPLCSQRWMFKVSLQFFWAAPLPPLPPVVGHQTERPPPAATPSAGLVVRSLCFWLLQWSMKRFPAATESVDTWTSKWIIFNIKYLFLIGLCPSSCKTRNKCSNFVFSPRF